MLHQAFRRLVLKELWKTFSGSTHWHVGSNCVYPVLSYFLLFFLWLLFFLLFSKDQISCVSFSRINWMLITSLVPWVEREIGWMDSLQIQLSIVAPGRSGLRNVPSTKRGRTAVFAGYWMVWLPERPVQALLFFFWFHISGWACAKTLLTLIF